MVYLFRHDKSFAEKKYDGVSCMRNLLLFFILPEYRLLYVRNLFYP